MNGHLSTLVHGGVAHHCHEVEAGPWPPTPGGDPRSAAHHSASNSKGTETLPLRGAAWRSAPPAKSADPSEVRGSQKDKGLSRFRGGTGRSQVHRAKEPHARAAGGAWGVAWGAELNADWVSLREVEGGGSRAIMQMYSVPQTAT